MNGLDIGKKIGDPVITDMNISIRSSNRGGKYLTFSLESEAYGIHISKIKEIIGMMPITSVPQTPAYIKGVINLRGKVVPVIDLRLRFGMSAIDYTDRTCIIVMDIKSETKTLIIGIVVDSVSEVLNIKNEDVEDTPDFGTKLDTAYIFGIAKTDSGVKILIDIDLIVSSDDIECTSRHNDSENAG